MTLRTKSVVLILAAMSLSPANVVACDVAPWAFTGAMPEAMGDPAGVLLDDGLVLVTAGNTPSGASSGVATFDPSSGSWAISPPLLNARRYATATRLDDGSVLIVGGRGPGLSEVLPAEVRDPASGIWSGAGALGESRIFHQATLLPDGRVLITGGSSADSAVTRASCEIYLPASRSFESAAPMPFSTGEHEALLLPDGTVLVTGGRGNAGSGLRQLAAAALYDPVADSWTRLPDMTVEREAHSMVLLGSGNVLIAGGMTLGELPLSEAEIYDPVGRVFTPTSSMSAARGQAGLVRVTCERALMVGGTLSSHYADASLAGCELYDEATGTWSAAPSLLQPRHQSVVLPLGENRVIAAAGDSRPASGLVSSVELISFDPPSERLVAVDVKPGNPQGVFNPDASGTLRVVILGSAETDVTELVAPSIRLAGAPVRTLGNGTPDCRLGHSNTDAYLDLSCRVDIELMSVPVHATSLGLTGLLEDGTAVVGSDGVRPLHG